MYSVLAKLGVVSRREQASCNSKEMVSRREQTFCKVGDCQSQKCDLQSRAAIWTNSGNLAGISGWVHQRYQKGSARTDVA